MFLDPSQIKDVYIHIKPVDFRKGIYGLGAHVKHQFGDSISGKNLFVFCNRIKDKVRIIYWDDTGFALWHKVLESDKFKWPKRNVPEIVVSQKELRYLLSGINIDLQKPHKNKPPKSLY